MKVIYIALTLYLTSQILSTETNLRNHHRSKSLANSSSQDRPKLMESVVYKKAIPIESNSQQGAQQAQRFKEEENMKNLETPQIVPSIGFGPRYNLNDRIARGYSQSIKNSQSYDILYGSHANYYNKDKRAFVYDKHFEDTEKYLVNEFRQALTRSINFDPKLKHVDDYKGPQLRVDLSTAPKYNAEAVRSDMNYGQLTNKADKNVLRGGSNPYKDVFGQDPGVYTQP